MYSDVAEDLLFTLWVHCFLSKS